MNVKGEDFISGFYALQTLYVITIQRHSTTKIAILKWGLPILSKSMQYLSLEIDSFFKYTCLRSK